MSTKILFTYLFLFITAIVGVSCEASRRTTSLKKQYKSIYVEQFKLTYLRQLLVKSYNNSKAVQEIIGTDHSGFTEPILTEDDYKIIDSLTMIDNEHLKIDSTNGKQRAEGAQGKRPLGFIVEKISGKWLDSLARQRLKLNGMPNSWTN